MRTFSDCGDPAPGFREADLVAHSAPVTRGNFVQTLVFTDIATGWTECAPVLYREQTLLREVLTRGAQAHAVRVARVRHRHRVAQRRADTAFINLALRDYCRAAGIVFTRCRPWRKNDQAFVEQKNGAVVRGIVGYRRPKGLEAAAALSRLYATTRLYVNFFQQSLKLASKRRDGPRRISKSYHAPAIPSQRLLADLRTPAAVCERVATLEPIRLRRQIGRISNASSTSPTGRSRRWGNGTPSPSTGYSMTDTAKTGATVLCSEFVGISARISK